MHRLRMAVAAGVTVIAASASAGAQMRVASTSIPAGMTPPAGMCRVWLAGVAPGRQPAPTSCAVARTQAPAGARIIYGPRAELRTGDVRGGYDPRYGDRDRDGRWDPSDRARDRDGRWDSSDRDRDRERWDRLSEKERRKLMKEREKERRKEWKRRQKARHHDRHDDDDDDRRGRYERNDNRRSLPARIGLQSGRVTVPGRTESVDQNHDGVGDGGARRIP